VIATAPDRRTRLRQYRKLRDLAFDVRADAHLWRHRVPSVYPPPASCEALVTRLSRWLRLVEQDGAALDRALTMAINALDWRSPAA
jgi:hypothetical protein